MADKIIAMKTSAPVVSIDSTTPEAIMAREAKKLQVQADMDSFYDTKLERFCGSSTPPLLGLTVALGLLFLSKVFQRRR